jgi:hypothetical protein
MRRVLLLATVAAARADGGAEVLATEHEVFHRGEFQACALPPPARWFRAPRAGPHAAALLSHGPVVCLAGALRWSTYSNLLTLLAALLAHRCVNQAAGCWGHHRHVEPACLPHAHARAAVPPSAPCLPQPTVHSFLTPHGPPSTQLKAFVAEQVDPGWYPHVTVTQCVPCPALQLRAA